MFFVCQVAKGLHIAYYDNALEFIGGVALKKGNVFLCGGDKRSVYMAEYFTNMGYEVEAFGHGEGGSLDCASRADMIVLGLPAIKNGMVNMPLCNTELPFDELLGICSKSALLLGGRFSSKDFDLAKAHGIRAADYSEDEIFQQENALYTAEGTLCALIENTACSLCGMKILVTGGGRISKAIGSLLACAPCKMSFFARSELQRTYFAMQGYDVLSQLCDLSEFDAVINTVPADILSCDALKSLGKNSVIIDLSQRPGYVDKDRCAELGLRLVYLPGLPLTSAPRSAGITAAKAAERLYASLERI